MCSKVLAPEVVANSADLLGDIGRDVSFLFIPHDEDSDFAEFTENGSDLAALEVFLSGVGICFGHIHELLLGESNSCLGASLSGFDD